MRVNRVGRFLNLWLAPNEGAGSSASASASAEGAGAGGGAGTGAAGADAAAGAGAGSGASGGGNEEAKFRRLFEKEASEKAALAERLAKLEAEAKARADAELSELELAKQKATEAETKAAKLEHDRLVDRIAAEHNIPTEARELLTGADEAALKASAERLVGLMRTPVKAGTTTQPGAQEVPTIEQQIATEIAAGRQLNAIRLMRQAQGITK